MRNVHANDLTALQASFDACRPCGPAMIAGVLLESRSGSKRLEVILANAPAEVNAALFRALGQLVEHAGRFECVTIALERHGRAAAGCGLLASDLEHVSMHLRGAVRTMNGRAWNARCEHAWAILLDAALGAMLVGTMRAQAGRMAA